MRSAASAKKIASHAAPKADADNTGLLGITLQCPRCAGLVQNWVCSNCGLCVRTIEGVVHALPPERVAYHARFVEEYQQVCNGQVTDPPSDEYYLGLPYGIASRQSSLGWSSRARNFDCLLGRVLKPALPRDARILDIGAGNCWLSYRLALAGYSPCAIDLLTNDQHGLGAAKHYRNYLPEFFPRIRAEMAHLPFRDSQFQAVIFNASLHYAEKAEVALREALRCCTPSGIVVISDTPMYHSAEQEKSSVTEPGSPLLTCESVKSLESSLKIRWSVHYPPIGPTYTLRRVNGWLWSRAQIPHQPIYTARKMPK